ncbi:MAG: hypothetical protein NUV77_24670 [Thermoguttaceae bacterium]|jgi:hypothetical protein|nr:hypothetical protein [Thermoguttaceae bacterium]
MPLRPLLLVACIVALGGSAPRAAETKPEFSGIYPHLAMFNNEGECGTGAVVPWADRLWVVTYGPHFPFGSSDKLYEIDQTLTATIRPESVGGTHANRMIHRESGQLFIGPYAIDRRRHVRVISPKVMPGRLTATMRHLVDPAHKVYFATMEEGFYEVDVKTLAVRELYPDANRGPGGIAGPLLPGYHGKGAYTGQGRVVYANNGEASAEARRRPDIPSGCLAEWDGTNWLVVRRNQFTEVTGPGGISGNDRPETDPLWSIGWDHRSLILMLRDGGRWYPFRLPKAAHTYDGAHGWNTEWPRIREVGEPDLLMTMHGTFWRFPRTFSAANTAGIRPRSTYLKVIGDFARWGDRLVFGCDDTAKSEFINRRKAKGNLAAPGQSQSNLWFADLGLPDRLGPALGRGAVWVREAVKADQPSDPYLFAGYDRRGAHVAHNEPNAVTFVFEVDREGRGQWNELRRVKVGAEGYAWVEFSASDPGEWIRVRADRDCRRATVAFCGSNVDRRSAQADPIFDGLATIDEAEFSAGLVHARGENRRTLALAATTVRGRDVTDVGYYEWDTSMRLRRVDDPAAHAWMKKNVAIPQGFVTVDGASVLFVDDAGRRWRLPKGDAAFDPLTGAGLSRIDREVVTERDLFHCHGTFYELPAENAGGFAKIRPIATHRFRITDYCSYRGLLVLTGVGRLAKVASGNRHIVRSDDGKAAIWAGAIDDLWKLGKPVGRGGPWNGTPVKAGQPSDPYLMTGYDRKRLTLAHASPKALNVRVEADLTGDGDWAHYRTFEVPPGHRVEHEFPGAFQAYWVRVVADRDAAVTAQLDYQ